MKGQQWYSWSASRIFLVSQTDSIASQLADYFLTKGPQWYSWSASRIFLVIQTDSIASQLADYGTF